jgi:restriction system protein
MTYYLVRVGEGSKYINEAKKNNFIAIGWEDLEIDLNKINNIEDLKQNLIKSYPNYTNSQLGVQAGQIFRFKELQHNDVVLSPIGNGQYSVGIITGNYNYKTNPTDACPYKHRHQVKWLDTILKKQDMSSNLTYSLGATLTIFSLDKYSGEIQSLIDGKSITPAEQPERIRDVIINGLFELDGKEFEEFASHLLSIIGFKATTTQYVGDKGIDVNGILNVDGIAEIILRVQVKRMKGSIGNKDILAMRGTLAQGEHACFITLSSFSKQAQVEAEAAGKVSVKLIDGEDLASLVLKHFDDIDQKYRSLFLIKKRKTLILKNCLNFKVCKKKGREN